MLHLQKKFFNLLKLFDVRQLKYVEYRKGSGGERGIWKAFLFQRNIVS